LWPAAQRKGKFAGTSFVLIPPVRVFLLVASSKRRWFLGFAHLHLFLKLCDWVSPLYVFFSFLLLFTSFCDGSGRSDLPLPDPRFILLHVQTLVSNRHISSLLLLGIGINQEICFPRITLSRKRIHLQVLLLLRGCLLGTGAFFLNRLGDRLSFRLVRFF